MFWAGFTRVICSQMHKCSDFMQDLFILHHQSFIAAFQIWLKIHRNCPDVHAEPLESLKSVDTQVRQVCGFFFCMSIIYQVKSRIF